MEPKQKPFYKKINPFLLAVPLSAAVATILFPLRPLAQQAMIGIILIWLYVFLLFGYHP